MTGLRTPKSFDFSLWFGSSGVHQLADANLSTKRETAEAPRSGIYDKLPHSHSAFYPEISSDILSFSVVFPYIDSS
jgi:hypothetical protein